MEAGAVGVLGDPYNPKARSFRGSTHSVASIVPDCSAG